MNDIVFLSAGNGQYIESEIVSEFRRETVAATLYLSDGTRVARLICDDESDDPEGDVVSQALAWIRLADDPSARYSLQIARVTQDDYLLIDPLKTTSIADICGVRDGN